MFAEFLHMLGDTLDWMDIVHPHKADSLCQPAVKGCAECCPEKTTVTYKSTQHPVMGEACPDGDIAAVSTTQSGPVQQSEEGLCSQLKRLFVCAPYFFFLFTHGRIFFLNFRNQCNRIACRSRYEIPATVASVHSDNKEICKNRKQQGFWVPKTESKVHFPTLASSFKS